MSTDYVGPPAAAGEFVLRDVTVVDVADGSRTAGQDIRIADGTIAAIGNSGPGTGSVPEVAGNGAFVVPGYVDAHAHALNHPDQVAGAYALMLAGGVTGFRQMSGSPRLLARRKAGRLPAPPGAPELLATPGALLTPLNAGTAQAARAEVRAQREQGADFIKAGMTSRETFLAALDEANRVGLPLAGHLPGDLDPREAARGGVRCVEHLGPGPAVFAATCGCEAEIRAAPARTIRLPKHQLPGAGKLLDHLISQLVVNPATATRPSDARNLALADASFDEQRALDLAALFAERGTWHCPTLIRLHTQQFPDNPAHADDPRLRFIDPAEVARWRKSAAKFARLPEETRQALRAHWPAELRLTRVLADAGVPLLAGTDANGAGFVIPGFALHDEFDLLAAAGLTPGQILRMTTLAPARFFGLEAAAGRVAPGYHADLVLLGGDPLDSHQALHDITGVVRGGSLWSRAGLDAAVARVAARPITRLAGPFHGWPQPPGRRQRRSFHARPKSLAASMIA
jgi:imidazolonepropionase-like amidohydrolase